MGDIELDELWESAYSFGKRGMFDEARLCFERYAVRDPSKDKSWCLLSEIHARMGNPQGAVRHASVAARISGHNQSGAEALFLLANGHMAMNRFDLARQLYYRRFPTLYIHTVLGTLDTTSCKIIIATDLSNSDTAVDLGLTCDGW